MKLYYIGIHKSTDDKKVINLTSAEDLSSFNIWERTTVREFAQFFAETVVARTAKGQKQCVEEKQYRGYVFTRNEGVSGFLITDKEYPVTPAFSLLNKVLDEFIVQYPSHTWMRLNSVEKNQFSMPSLQQYLKKYQNPAEADALLRVQNELDETKTVLHKTIESVLERGENLDALAAKSDSLSFASQKFFTQSKKANSCCVIM